MDTQQAREQSQGQRTQQAQEQSKGQRERRGSFMSNKQIARAAIYGRQVTFRFLFSNPAHEITGYVIGMDDYHWLVASVIPEESRGTDEIISTTLVHKSAQMITIGGVERLSTEDASVQAAVSALGGFFWEDCKKKYGGKAPK